MANIKEAFEYASKNPDSDFAKNLAELAKSGSLNQEAQKYGIDLSHFQPAPEVKPNIVERATNGLIDIAKKRAGNIADEISTTKDRVNPLSPGQAPAETALRVIGQIGGAVGDVVEPIIKPVIDNVVAPISNKINEGIDAGMNKVNEAMGGNPLPTQQETMQYASDQYNKLPENARKDLTAVKDSLNLIPAWQVASKGSKVTGSVLKSSFETAGNILKKSDKVSGPVLNLAKDFLKPTADETTLTALAPFKADISPSTKVAVPLADGSAVMKSISELTQAEKQAVKGDILTKYQTYYDQGLKAVKNAKETTPADMVAKSVDNAVEKVNTLRKNVGSKMGAVEEKAKDVIVDLSNTKSLQGFIDNVTTNRGKAGYAGSNKLISETKSFLKDLNTLQKRQPSVKEVLDFTRQWQNKLENLKDKFNGFTRDKFDLTNIQSMVKDIKDQARNTLGTVDENYNKLVNTYRETSQLRDTANRLLGEEGLYGDTLKGASVVKRAVKSISDAGSRQFLKKLEDLTGYDGLSDAQVAIKAMQDAGDFRGLSLLELLKDAGGDTTLAGLAVKLGKSVIKKVAPSEKTKVENFIKKD